MFKRNRNQPTAPAPVLRDFEFHYRGNVYMIPAFNRGEVLDLVRQRMSAQAAREGFLA